MAYDAGHPIGIHLADLNHIPLSPTNAGADEAANTDLILSFVCVLSGRSEWAPFFPNPPALHFFISFGHSVYWLCQATAR
jgi:hypothetical protein